MVLSSSTPRLACGRESLLLVPLGLLLLLGLEAVRHDGASEMNMKTSKVETGKVFPTHSSNYTEESQRIADALQLAPGMSYGEVGGGAGTFFRLMSSYVMPGGQVFGTGASPAEVNAMLSAVAGIEGLASSAVVAGELTSGLPTKCCDVILLRMVYHMLAEPRAYLQDFKRALKPGGKLLLLEHDAGNGMTGREGAVLDVVMPNGMSMSMGVVPPAALLTEVVSAGFTVVTDHFPKGIIEPWPYFNDPGHGIDERGYALLLTA